MRVLVVGAGGQLGRELARLPGHAHEVIALDRAACDITEAGEVARALQQQRPDALINCAAWTKVDAAESRPDKAFRVNASGPRVLAAACRESGARLLQVSTDYVFDGTDSAPVDELAPTNPVGVYARSKLAGENEVRALCPDHQIVRTSWLYGQDGPNFVLTMLRLGAEGDQVRVVADQRGAPTWTGHLAPALLRLLEVGHPGTYHLSNSGETSWCEFAKAIMREAGLSAQVIPITTAEYGAPAARPAYSVLANLAWRKLGEPALPPWHDGLRAYVRERMATLDANG